jgi:hypothetical protein
LADPGPPPTSSDRLHKKSDFLICWIYTHHLLGMTLFAMALYTCHSGIVLQYEINHNSEDEDAADTSWTKNSAMRLFWGVTGSIVACILLVRCIYPLLQNKYLHHHQDDDQPPSTFSPRTTNDYSLNSSNSDTKGSNSQQQQQEDDIASEQYDC